MMKFKKFLAAAMTGAMMLGVVAAAAPAVNTYAAITDNFQVVLDETTAPTLKPDSSFKVKASFKGDDSLDSATVAWSSDNEAVATVLGDQNDSSKATVTILSGATANAAVTITASVTVGENTYTGEYPFTVAADQNQSTDDRISVDYASYTATISALNGEKDVFLEVLKAAKTEDAKPTVKNTYHYSVPDGSSSVTVDLSFLNPKQEQLIRVYGSSNLEDKSKPHTIEAQSEKFTMKYKYDEGKGGSNWYKGLTIKEGKDTPFSPDELSQLEGYFYRSLYGTTWQPLKDFPFETVNVAGTTIVVRYEEKEGEKLVRPASAEVKVKIPAIPKAPSIKVDYVKDKIKITNKQKWGVVEDNGTVAYTQTGDITISELQTPCTVAVVVVGSGKKQDSNPVFIHIPAAPGISKSSDNMVVSTEDDNKYIKCESANEDGTAIKLTVAPGCSFDYKVGDANWKTIKSTNSNEKSIIIKNATSASVRLSAVNDTKKNGEIVKGNLQSQVETISISGGNPSISNSKIDSVEMTSDSTIEKKASGDTTLKLEANVKGVDGYTLTEEEKAVTWEFKSAKKSDETTDAQGVSVEGDTLTILSTSDVDNNSTITVIATPTADPTKAKEFDIKVTVGQ